MLGFIAPVETRDRVNWRTLNMAFNYQAQYIPIPSAMFLWTHWSRSLADQKRKFDTSGVFSKDSTRELIYDFLEIVLNQKGKAGRECVLKTICETAAHPLESRGVFDEIFHLIFTPNEHDAPSDHINSLKAGRFGTDCGTLYPKCPKGDGILEHISKLL